MLLSPITLILHYVYVHASAKCTGKLVLKAPMAFSTEPDSGRPAPILMTDKTNRVTIVVPGPLDILHKAIGVRRDGRPVTLEADWISPTGLVAGRALLDIAPSEFSVNIEL